MDKTYKNVKDDSNQYREEWFDVAKSLGKEFEIPNISNESYLNDTSLSFPKISLQSHPLQTNPSSAELDALSDAEIPLFPRPSINVAVDPAPLENKQANNDAKLISTPSKVASQPLPIPTNQINVKKYSRSHNLQPNAFVAMRNQKLHGPSSLDSPDINFCLRNQRTHFGTSLNKPLSIHLPFGQNHFSDIPKYPLSHSQPTHASIVMDRLYCFKSTGFVSEQQNHNGIILRANKPIHVSNMAGTSYPFSKDSLILSSHANLNKPSPSLQNQETQVHNPQVITPKQKPQDLAEVNSSTMSLDDKILTSPLHSPTQKVPNDPNKPVARESPVEYYPEGDEHRCIICNATFGNGNALRGHMSSHAKRRKSEAIIRTDLVFESGVSSSGPSQFSVGVQDGSNVPTMTNTATDYSATIEGKIEGNESSNESAIMIPNQE